MRVEVWRYIRSLYFIESISALLVQIFSSYYQINYSCCMRLYMRTSTSRSWNIMCGGIVVGAVCQKFGGSVLRRSVLKNHRDMTSASDASFLLKLLLMVCVKRLEVLTELFCLGVMGIYLPKKCLVFAEVVVDAVCQNLKVLSESFCVEESQLRRV